MANMKEILPKGEYKIKTVGPPRNWEYNGTAMITDSVQLEGFEQFWIDLNRKAESPVPVPGDTIKGHVEQDEAAKYAPKFKKESAGGWSGGGGGGGKASPGAIQAQNVTTATAIVSAFYSLTGKKPKDFTAFMAKIETVAPSVGKMVDRLVAAQPAATTTTAPATNHEAGETPAAAPAPKADVAVEDISDEDLGEW